MKNISSFQELTVPGPVPRLLSMGTVGRANAGFVTDPTSLVRQYAGSGDGDTFSLPFPGSTVAAPTAPQAYSHLPLCACTCFP